MTTEREIRTAARDFDRLTSKESWLYKIARSLVNFARWAAEPTPREGWDDVNQDLRTKCDEVRRKAKDAL